VTAGPFSHWRTGVPAEQVKELIALVQRAAGQISYASSGARRPAHLAMDRSVLWRAHGMIHVP